MPPAGNVLFQLDLRVDLDVANLTVEGSVLDRGLWFPWSGRPQPRVSFDGAQPTSGLQNCLVLSTFVMCLKLGQAVHCHLAQSTVEQSLGLFLLFLATSRQGSWGWSPPFTLGCTLTSLWNAGKGWGARLFLWGSWGWTQSILHGNWMGSYTIPIWGGAAWGSWVSRFPDARLPASGLGSLNAFDSSGVAITLVVCLSLALRIEADLTDITGNDGPLGLEQGSSKSVGEHSLLYRVHSAVVAKEAQGGGRLQWEGQDLLEVQRGLHDGGLPEQREGPCPAQAAEDHAGDPGARASTPLCPGGRSGPAGGTGGGVGGGAEAGPGGAGAEPVAGEDGRRGDQGTQGSIRGRPGGPSPLPLSLLVASPGSPAFRVSLQPGLENKTSRRQCETIKETEN